MDNKGMMTIEAAIIIPISLAVTVLLIWLGFYYYDRNLLASVAAEAAMYGTEHSEYSNEEIKDMVEHRVKECLNNRTVLLDELQMTVTVSYSDIVVELSSGLDIPGNLMYGGIYQTDMWNINCVKRSPRLNNSSFVRAVKIIKEL